MLIVQVALEILVAGNVALGKRYGAEIVVFCKEPAEVDVLNTSSIADVVLMTTSTTVVFARALAPSKPVALETFCWLPPRSLEEPDSVG